MLTENGKRKLLFLKLSDWEIVNEYIYKKCLKSGDTVYLPLLSAYDAELRERERNK